MRAKSNQPRFRRKLVPPDKPYDGFPLSIHASGKFQESFRLPNNKRKVVYFGAWAIPSLAASSKQQFFGHVRATTLRLGDFEAIVLVCTYLPSSRFGASS
jgi:hypothetical protein